MTTHPVEVAGRVLQVSSLDRVLWPATGTTKAELLDYYLRVAPALLPHVVDRPITLHRFPTGVGGPHFFQTRTPPHPEWVRTVTLSYGRTGKTFEAPVIDDLAGLVWAANLTTIELHPFLAKTATLDHPTTMVFDLDPGPPAGVAAACQVALLVRDELAAHGRGAYVKSSGGKGAHVFVPVARMTYDETKSLARELAARLAAEHPDLVVDRMTKSVRSGRVFIDWSQNDPGKSTVAPWSLRGHARPTVSAPLTWQEVEHAARTGDPRGVLVTPAQAVRRLDEHGDLFAGVVPAGRPG